MKRYLKNKDFLAGIFFLLFDAFYLFFSLQIPVSDSSTVGAGFMPRIYGYCMLVVAVILLITSFLRIKRNEGHTEESETLINKEDLIRIIIAFVTILLYVVFLKDIGFIICSIPLLFVLVLLLTPKRLQTQYIQKHFCDGDGILKEEYKNSKGKVKFLAMLPHYVRVLLFAVIYTVVIYILFAKGLGLKMPNGILKNILPF